jgi:hypothetical protein
MILMGMGEDRRADRSILHILQQWRCVMAYMLGIHSAVKDHGPFRKIEAVTVGTDPGTPRQIRKTHVRGVYENGVRTREGNFDSARLSDDLREILKTSNHTATFHRKWCSS